MSKNIIKNKNSWDELDDIDELLTSNSKSIVDDSAVTGVSRDSHVSVKTDSQKTESDISVVSNAEGVACIVGKSRRRSALDEDGVKKIETKVVGYSERSQRLSGEGGAIANVEFAEEEKSEFNRLLAKGVYLLGMREHSVQEMTDKLTARSDAIDVVLAVVDELLENNYLSNERFAESYVRSRRNKGFGPVKVRVELKTKGISNRLISEHLQAESPEWIDVAREQYKKKYRSEAEDYKEWTKRARFMQSRGFAMEHIQAVLPSADFY